MSTKRWAAVFAICAASLVGRAADGDDKGAREVTESRFPVVAGIGAALSITDDGPRIGLIHPGSVAERCKKLHESDRILSVRNGDQVVTLKGKPMGDVVSLIRGPVGTTVTLEILPKGGESSFLLSLKREAVPLSGKSSTYDDLIGRTAPPVQFSALDQSSRITLSEYAGKVVVLDFWASWCGTCYAPVDKMQEIARSHPEWKDRVVLLTATIDTDLQAASRVVKARHWEETTHLALDPETLEAIGIMTVPAVMILSPDGKITAVGDPHAIPIEDEVSKLLSAPGSDGRSE